MSKRNMILLMAVVLYVISPIDFMPGPIDDAIVALVGYALRDKSTDD